ncbi:MAG: M24 family metallopeptidase, partial [Patescibacteria group bacterium]
MAADITIKTAADVETLRYGGRRLGDIVRRLTGEVRPGISTRDLDTLAEQWIIAAGGVPVFKGYRVKEVATPFPASICASINEEVVHGIPRPDKILREGDIVGIDIGMRWPAYAPTTDHRPPTNNMGVEQKAGLVTDMAVTVGVGKITPDAARLIRATREALDAGIAIARPGAAIGDIGHAVAARLKEDNLGIIRDLAGHGVGYELHEPPLIPNYGTAG